VDVRWHSRVVRDECRIIGTEGEIDLTPMNGPELRYPGGEENLPVHKNLHYPCVENFVGAVLDGAYLYASGESSIVTDWVTECLKKIQGQTERFGVFPAFEHRQVIENK
jgi:hypothetical protein